MIPDKGFLTHKGLTLAWNKGTDFPDDRALFQCHVTVGDCLIFIYSEFVTFETEAEWMHLWECHKQYFFIDANRRAMMSGRDC